MIALPTVLLIIALFFFLLDGFSVLALPRINLTALGFALVTLAFLISSGAFHGMAR